MGKRPTIQMVADLAGVSRGTVDRVLNGRSYVSAEVRQRVLDALNQTGYLAAGTLRHTRRGGSEPRRLGVLLPNWDDQFFTEVERGVALAQEELAEDGVEILVRRCKTDIPQEALELLGELASAKAAGLAVCTVNDRSVAAKVAELAEAGIPCVTFNSDLPDSRRLCFIGQDIHQAGRVAAELMSQCVPADSLVLATVGNRKFDGHRGRLEGFCRRLEEKGFSESQIIVAETFNDYRTTVSVVSQALEQHPALRGIYMANLSVSGCAEALRLAGKKGQVRLICHDINESTRQLLLDGSVAFTIPQDMVQQGYAPLILLRDFLWRGKPLDEQRFSNRILLLCAENL